jgi:hypothetical protein
MGYGKLIGVVAFPFVIFSTASAWGDSIPSMEWMMEHLKREHPRIILTEEVISRTRENIGKDGKAREWYDRIRMNAQRILTESPSRYEIPDGLRLLATSKRVLMRVYTLATVYLLDGDTRYVERAWEELKAAAEFPDWNPRHFLDTAEMTHAFAIGYDWLYKCFSEEQREVLRNAIVEKGLKPALEVYRKWEWWPRSPYNWNQVCNGGIACGALAIADEFPSLAFEIIRNVLRSVRISLDRYSPDGAWPEGPGYWAYATSYAVILMTALESAFGTDFGLSNSLGLSETGLFPIYITGPLGLTFNFADAGEREVFGPQLFWFANRFGLPVCSWYERRNGSPHPLDLLWLSGGSRSPKEAGLPLDRYFRGVEVVSMRSSWEGKDAVFIGFKAGDNKVGHSHLDLGTFVLDAFGHRWAIDLGADNYNLPGYFGAQRFSYYRTRAEGHNCLVINPGRGPDQDPNAVAKIVDFRSDADEAYVLADLTPAYKENAKKVLRSIRFIGRKVVEIEDDVEANNPSEVWWFMHTRAGVEIREGGKEAVLVQGSEKLIARIVSPEDGGFTVMDAVPLESSPSPSGQARNEGVRKLAIRLSGVERVKIVVRLGP